MSFIGDTIRYFTPEKRRAYIAGQSVKMEIDSFDIGFHNATKYGIEEKFVKLSKQTFILNDVIGKICKTFSKAEFLSDNENDMLIEKLNKPNKKQSRQEFLKEFAYYIKASGWVVVWKRYESVGNFKTMELISLNPDYTEFGKDGNINSEYENECHAIDKEDCIVFYDSTRQTNGKGDSVILPLKSQIYNIMTSQVAKSIQIDNSGTTIVSPKVSAHSNSVDEGLNSMIQQEIPGLKTQKQEMEEKLGSRGLYNRIIVASKGLDAVNLSAQLNEVNFDDKVEADKLAVFGAFNFPPELSPYGKDPKYENLELAELSLVELEIFPLAESLVITLNQEFSKEGNIRVSFNHLNCMSVVESRIQKTNTETINQYTTILENGGITVDQYKRILKDKKIIP